MYNLLAHEHKRLPFTQCSLYHLNSLTSSPTHIQHNHSSGHPLEDLQRLYKLKSQVEKENIPSQIISYTYQDETVFWINSCIKCPDGLIIVYNYNGEQICEFGGLDGRNTYINFKTEASDITMLYDNSKDKFSAHHSRFHL